jgi:hypothetical protein
MASTLAAGALVALGASGCTVTATIPALVTDVAEVSVQPGATTTPAPGTGVGLFVQYDKGGHWQLSTTCDTSVSGASCTFDVTVTASSGVRIDNAKGVSLEPTDSFVQYADGSLNLLTETTFGSDGLSFDADPGATIQVDMLLDGIPQPRYVYVVSQGRSLSGVPTNPVDLRPEAP